MTPKPFLYVIQRTGVGFSSKYKLRASLAVAFPCSARMLRHYGDSHIIKSANSIPPNLELAMHVPREGGSLTAPTCKLNYTSEPGRTVHIREPP